ncbi:MAG TPA: PilZ domain-containing protein [Sphingobium sp.]|jgi:hypothetical protein|nr:PilZ domain-containing protein [Sphingobium sp.]
MGRQDDIKETRTDRIPMDLTVAITSVLFSGDAVIRNLTEHGALIEGMSLPKDMQFQIEFNGQTVFGIVAWSEPDRLGARFPFPLQEGPLHIQLEHARSRHEMRVPVLAGGSPFAGLRRPISNFGRRGI